MKLNLESIKNTEDWKGYRLPGYDPAVIAANTAKNPQWLHFGSGNIFRMFLAAICQRLIEAGAMDTGIICCGSHDNEVILKSFKPFDNLTVAVTLNADGTLDKEVIASIADSMAMHNDFEKIGGIFAKPSLQMVSLTITEKGYNLRNAEHELNPDVAEDMEKGPACCRTFIGRLASLCLIRKKACGTPLALVSMDNCSANGERLKNAVTEIAAAWLEKGLISAEDYSYLENDIAYPWSVIDKITPRPHPIVEKTLVEDGIEGISQVVTSRGSYTAPFVNAEKAQYLVIEDCFPNGRPPLEKAGVIITDRETVNKVEKMKVGTCLNPLHTCLAVYGCLLGCPTIADAMKDPELSVFVDRMSHEEGMPFVVDPGVIDPEKFLDEVLNERLPNPFLPDTPQRIATDTSQKLATRFGGTIKAYEEAPDKNAADLVFIPLVLAGWLRYLMGVDDNGNAYEISPDPLLKALKGRFIGAELGDKVNEEYLRPTLKDPAIFGVDLYECGLAEKVISYLDEMASGPGAVRAALKKYTAV